MGDMETDMVVHAVDMETVVDMETGAEWEIGEAVEECTEVMTAEIPMDAAVAEVEDVVVGVEDLTSFPPETCPKWRAICIRRRLFPNSRSCRNGSGRAVSPKRAMKMIR